jgi:hypothetical protein
MAFPHIQTGSFTPIAGTSAIKYGTIAWATTQRLYDVTGGTDAQSHYDFGPTLEEMVGEGWAFTTRHSSQQQSSITLGSVSMHPDKWTLRKSWPLYEVSGFDPQQGVWDDNAAWGYGTPTYDLMVEGGVTESSGPGLRQKRVSTSIFGEGIGTITWDSDTHVEAFRMTGRFTRGGKPQATFTGKVEGKCSVTGTPTDGNDLRWLLAPGGVSDHPVRGRFTLDTGAESITENAYMYDVTIRWDRAAKGGKVTTASRMRLDYGNKTWTSL